MLVLSRKPLQSILIGSDVRITIVKVDRNNVRIGIEAPGEVSIMRAELLEGDDAPASPEGRGASTAAF